MHQQHNYEHNPSDIHKQRQLIFVQNINTLLIWTHITEECTMLITKNKLNWIVKHNNKHNLLYNGDFKYTKRDT